jgi:hypothetical protein
MGRPRLPEGKHKFPFCLSWDRNTLEIARLLSEGDISAWVRSLVMEKWNERMNDPAQRQKLIDAVK